MLLKPWLRGFADGDGALLAASAHADFPSVPKETYKALNLEQSASPKQLHEALVKRYKDPAQGAGRGTLAKYWEPIPIQHVHGSCLVLQAADLDERSGGSSGMRQMPHGRIAGMGQCLEEEQRMPTWTRSGT